MADQAHFTQGTMNGSCYVLGPYTRRERKRVKKKAIRVRFTAAYTRTLLPTSERHALTLEKMQAGLLTYRELMQRL